MRIQVVTDPEVATKVAPLGILPYNRYIHSVNTGVGRFQAQLEKSIAADSGGDPVRTVQHGDTLSHIVRDQLKANGEAVSGSAIQRGVLAVAKANQLHDPDLILPGQQIDLGVLQPKSAVESAVAPMSVQEDVAALPAESTDTRQQAMLAKLAALPRVPDPDLMALTSVPAEGGPVLRMPEPVAARSLFARIARETVEKTEDLGDLIQRILHPRQPLSEPKALVKRANPWKSTLDGPARLTSEYGKRSDPFTGDPAFHSGIDLATKSGTKVYAFKPGTVTFSGWKTGYGNVVIVEHEDGLESVYGHNASNKVKMGDTVDAQTVLAEVGSTGRSTGPHLHFEIRSHGKAVNPVPYLTQRDAG